MSKDKHQAEQHPVEAGRNHAQQTAARNGEQDELDAQRAEPDGTARHQISKPDERKAVQGTIIRIYPPRGGAHAGQLADSSRDFARGDFGHARQLACAVLEANPSAEERSFAQEILRRTGVDPIALGVGLISFALFCVVLCWTFLAN